MSRGFSLVEMLVALTVLSVGLLGSAGLLISGLRDQSQALMRSAVTSLLVDMADRIRTNTTAGAAYDTRNASLAQPFCDIAVSCDPAHLAAQDLAEFQSRAETLLAHRQARTQIHFEPAIGAAAPDRFVISLDWRDARDPHSPEKIALVVLAAPVAGAP